MSKYFYIILNKQLLPESEIVQALKWKPDNSTSVGQTQGGSWTSLLYHKTTMGHSKAYDRFTTIAVYVVNNHIDSCRVGTRHEFSNIVWPALR